MVPVAGLNLHGVVKADLRPLGQLELLLGIDDQPEQPRELHGVSDEEEDGSDETAVVVRGLHQQVPENGSD